MSIATVLPTLRGEMSKMRIPSRDTKVYKDECVYSFDSPFSDNGLFVNTLNFQGVGQRYLDIDTLKTGCKVYLHELWRQVPKPAEEAESKEVPSKLAIGVEGGFLNTGKYDVVKEHALVVFHQGQRVDVPLPNKELPEFVSNIVQAIIDHEGMKSAMEVNTWEADNVKIVSKYADNLKQFNPTNRRIPQDPKQWKDEASDATENLWLNLSTGYIGGGRKIWDGTGGSGSALQHFIDTGKQYPLVVKLGTITPHGADVWSYADDEDCLVIDPHLADHLSFWGIDIMKLEKTEKSLSEMEVALNMSYDWSKIMEGQENLEIVSGPGLIGLRNIGSSCYLNSWMQCFLSIPEVSCIFSISIINNALCVFW
jgi:ubiquitin carboxyl-terminal hydrolase 5/13